MVAAMHCIVWLEVMCLVCAAWIVMRRSIGKRKD